MTDEPIKCGDPTMPKRFGSSLLNIRGHFAGLAAAGSAIIPQSVRQMQARERAEAQLAAIMPAADHAAVSGWIHQQHRGKTHLAKVMRGNAYLIVVELAKCGVPTDDLTYYALRQVLDLLGTETDVDTVLAAAQAYGAIHTAGAGPATGGIARAARQAFRYGY